jgi:phosphohistidine phosphatase
VNRVRKLIEQAGAIPFRRQFGHIQFCLVTSISGKRWGFPKGIVEAGDSHETTTLHEALEEAGLHGRIIGDPLGAYRYQKWGADLDVAVYLMEVTQTDEVWPEADLRQRVWLSPVEANSRLQRPEWMPFLEAACGRLGLRTEPKASGSQGQ